MSDVGQFIEIPTEEIRFFQCSIRGGAGYAYIFAYCQSGRWEAKVYPQGSDTELTWIQKPEENSLNGILKKCRQYLERIENVSQ